MYRFYLLLLPIFYCWSIEASGASIKGQLQLSEEWAPVVYISVIRSFDDLHTASYNFLRFQTEMDSAGYFEFKDLEVVAEDRLYRLHVCKKEDPVSTIMIGGQDENFFHFIMNKKSNIVIAQNDQSFGVQNIKLTGDVASNELSLLFNLENKLNSPLELPSVQNREYARKQVLKTFRSIAETGSNEIVRLLAVHFILDNFANLDHLQLMKKVQSDLLAMNYNGTYYDSFSERLNFLDFKNSNSSFSDFSWLKWLLYILLASLVVFLIYKSGLKGKHNSAKAESKINSLSTQEKKVFNLLKSGKSNKEISSELHIEVSTVKSHLNKIYSRLGVKSRKEIIDR